MVKGGGLRAEGVSPGVEGGGVRPPTLVLWGSGGVGGGFDF